MSVPHSSEDHSIQHTETKSKDTEKKKWMRDSILSVRIKSVGYMLPKKKALEINSFFTSQSPNRATFEILCLTATLFWSVSAHTTFQGNGSQPSSFWVEGGKNETSLLVKDKEIMTLKLHLLFTRAWGVQVSMYFKRKDFWGNLTERKAGPHSLDECNYIRKVQLHQLFFHLT